MESNCEATARQEEPEDFPYENKCTMSSVFSFIISAVVCLLGICMLSGGFEAVVRSTISNQLKIVPDSTAFDRWVNTPIPLRMSISFFNITNPDQFVSGSKPILEEVGPYVYREFHKKRDVKFHENQTVSYFQEKMWIWDQEGSGNLSESDMICMLNPLPVTAAYAANQKTSIALAYVNGLLKKAGEKAMISANVSDLLWQGFEDPFLDILNNKNRSIDTKIEAHFNGFKNEQDKYPDRFGFFYNRNMSVKTDGRFSMFNGQQDAEALGMIDTWNGMKDTDFFASPCNKISGSAGELWPPGLTDTSISFYSPDICRTLKLAYKEKSVDQFGIEGFRFWADKNTFAHPDSVPENQCYCLNNDRENCPQSGLLDMESCRDGSPVYISFPHFLHADPSLHYGVSGLRKPSEERDQFFIDMIPELGLPYQVKGRMQLNIQVTPYPGGGIFTPEITILKNVPTVVLPMLWFEVDAGLTKELAEQLSIVLLLMRSPILTVVFILLILITVMVCAALIFKCIRRRRRNDERQLLIA